MQTLERVSFEPPIKILLKGVDYELLSLEGEEVIAVINGESQRLSLTEAKNLIYGGVCTPLEPEQAKLLDLISPRKHFRSVNYGVEFVILSIHEERARAYFFNNGGYYDWVCIPYIFCGPYELLETISEEQLSKYLTQDHEQTKQAS